MTLAAPRIAGQGVGAAPAVMALQGLLEVTDTTADPFDWTLPRRLPAQALPPMLRVSQQLWALRVRPRR